MVHRQGACRAAVPSNRSGSRARCERHVRARSPLGLAHPSARSDAQRDGWSWLRAELGRSRRRDSCRGCGLLSARREALARRHTRQRVDAPRHPGGTRRQGRELDGEGQRRTIPTKTPNDKAEAIPSLKRAFVTLAKKLWRCQKEIDGTKGERSTPTPWNLARQRGCRLGFGVVICFSEFVIDLLQEPILTLSVSHSGLHDRPFSPKFRAIQGESHDAVVERCHCVGSLGSDHLKFAEVPYDDFARAIFTFREGFLEQKVVKRMVFDVDREAPHTRIFARPLRHGP